MNIDSVGIHTPHLASATLLSTSYSAVQWLRTRDRKLFMLDMESGGMMAAAWIHNQNNPHNQVKTMVIRAASDFCDERRNDLKETRRSLQNHAVQNVCYFLDWMFTFQKEKLPNLSKPSNTYAGIVVPLEEEFSYFVEQLSVPLVPHYDSNEARFMYTFDLDNQRKCVCQFIGDMGLVQTALTSNALINSCPNLYLMILIGVGGSINSDILVCDVAVANKIDPYLEGSETNSMRFGPLKHFDANESLLKIIKSLYETDKNNIRDEYRIILDKIHKLPLELGAIIRKPESLELHCVSFASSDAVAADQTYHPYLRGGERNNSVVEMESSGMHVAVEARNTPNTRSVNTLFFRGISDTADSAKSKLDNIEPVGILREIAMRNAASLVIRLLKKEELWNYLLESKSELK